MGANGDMPAGVRFFLRPPGWRRPVKLALLAAALVAFAVLLHTAWLHWLSLRIRSWGLAGALAAAGLMAVLAVVPVPSEFVFLFSVRVYGPWPGFFCSLLGTMFGTGAVYPFLRRVGAPWVARRVSPLWIEWIDDRVRQGKAPALLLARLLPLPAAVSNYALGVLPAVRWGEYMWTAAVGVLPYYATVECLYLGRWGDALAAALGGGACFLAAALTLLRRRRRSADSR